MKYFNFPKKIGIEHIFLAVAVILGSYLRFQGVFTNSFAFTYDVGRDMLALWDITHFVDLPFIGPTTGLPGLFYGPWWYWLLSPFSLIFGGDPRGIALIMGLLGIATVILFYYLGKKIGGEFIAVSLATLASFSHVLISLSSQIWNPNIAPFFTILTLIVLSKIYTGKKPAPISFLFLGALLTLSADIEVIYGILFSAGIVFSILFIKHFKFYPRDILLFFAGILIVLFPRILFEVKNSFLMTKSLFLFFESKDAGGPNFIELIPKRADIFLNHFSETISGGNKTIGAAIIVVIIICLVFLYKKASSTEKSLFKTSGIVIATFFIGTIFFGHDIWPHYLVGLPIFYILVTALTLSLIYRKLGAHVSVLLLACLLFINFNPISFVRSLNEPLWEGDASVYRNQLKVVDYVYRDAGARPFKYLVYTPPIHDYSYQYLFKWYGPTRFKLSPDVRAKLAYFILEPDFEQPVRLTNWLGDKKSYGKILKEEKVAGGITVQTRLIE